MSVSQFDDRETMERAVDVLRHINRNQPVRGNPADISATLRRAAVIAQRVEVRMTARDRAANIFPAAAQLPIITDNERMEMRHANDALSVMWREMSQAFGALLDPVRVSLQAIGTGLAQAFTAFRWPSALTQPPPLDTKRLLRSAQRRRRLNRQKRRRRTCGRSR